MCLIIRSACHRRQRAVAVAPAAARRVVRLMLLAVSVSLLAAGPARAQSEAAGSGDAAAPTDDPPPADDSGDGVPAEQAGGPTNYSEAIEAQQKWTRELREMSEPLLEGDYESEYVRLRGDYNRIRTNGGNLSGGQDQQTVRRALEILVFKATDPAVQQSPQKMKDALEQMRRELNAAGSAIANQTQKERFRQDFCRVAFDVIKQLLDNNWEARSFALSLLPDLEVVTAGFQRRRIEVFEGVPGLLVEVLTDGENQPDSIHMRAAAEISRLLRKTDTAPLIQMQMARGLAAELTRRETEIAYQMELVRALSEVTAAREAVGRPVPTGLQALVAVLDDNERHVLVRCESARAIGNAGYDSQINFEPIAWKIVQLSVRTGVIYNRNKNQQLNWVFSLCGADLYFAFHHEDEDLKGGANPQGLLNRAPRSEVVNQCYQQILKVSPPMWFGERVPNSDLVAVNNWVNENVPENLTWDANSPPLSK